MKVEVEEKSLCKESIHSLFSIPRFLLSLCEQGKIWSLDLQVEGFDA